MTDVLPFTPGTLITLTAATASAAYTLPSTSYGRQAMIYNSSATIPVVFRLGGATAVVPNGDPATFGVGAFIVAPATTRTFTIGDQTSLAYIRLGGSDAVFYLMLGMGQ